MELQKQIYKNVREQSILFRILAILPSKVFSVLAALRALLYKLNILTIRKLPGKCISIGNISLGGTGKTPLVIEVARILEANKRRVIILTRGYKSGLKNHEFMVLNDGHVCLRNHKVAQVYADEAMLQSKLLPNAYIVVGAKRYQAAQRLLCDSGFSSENLVFVLDDGYQHQKIFRDLNILLLDAEKPIGNGQVIPLGSLRESVKAIERCDMVIWTRANLVKNTDASLKKVKQFTEGKVSVDADFVEGKINKIEQGKIIEIDREELKNRQLFAITAIAHANRFFSSLDTIGVNVRNHLALPDHQRFDSDYLQEKISYYEGLITTAKDYWREPSLFHGLPISVYFLDLEIKISSHEFEKAILSVITD